MGELKRFFVEEDGIGTVEVILILVVNLIPYFGVDIVCIE